VHLKAHPRRHMAALLVASLIAVPAAAQSRSTSTGSAIVDLSRIRIDNFGRVDATYYRGAQPKGGDYADLASLGVKTVIDLTGDDADAGEEGMAKGAGMQYVHMPMTTHQPPSSAQLAEFLTLVNDPASQPVYVHCVGGRHRTGVMTAAYRMVHDSWTADRAFQEMKRYKFGADFLHSEFKQFVYGYHADAVPAIATAAVPPATKAGS
jgi:tyrosine-protein phosphatase SIW14